MNAAEMRRRIKKEYFKNHRNKDEPIPFRLLPTGAKIMRVFLSFCICFPPILVLWWWMNLIY